MKKISKKLVQKSMMKNIPKMAYGLTLYYHPRFTLTLSPAHTALNLGSAWFIPCLPAGFYCVLWSLTSIS